MIAASEPQEFVPFGRQQLLNHPKVAQPGNVRHHIESNLLNQFSQVAISDNATVGESWILRTTENQGVECEEELYYKDRTAVWSIGPASVNSNTNRVLKCCYTSESPIQEALWCNFHRSSLEFQSTFFSAVNEKPITQLEMDDIDSHHMKNCICILNSTCIKYFTPSGKEFVTTLQFEVQKMWSMKYGLLLERRVSKASTESMPAKKKVTVDLRRQSIEQSYLQKGSFNATHFNFPVSETIDPHSADLPTLFSLSHPLDEICPITSKKDSLSYITNADLRIVLTSECPSLCLCQDRKTGAHVVYIIRKALPQEAELCWRREYRRNRHNSYSKYSSSGTGSFNFEPENKSLPPFLSARTRKSLGLGATTFHNAPSSPYQSTFDARTSSPIPSHPFTSLSPMFSPYSASPYRRNETNSPYTATPSRLESRMMSEDVEYAEPKPLYPQICLQCVWTETLDAKSGQEGNAEATRSFLTTDLMGETFLAFLVKSKLNLLKLSVRGDESFSIVGEPAVIHAKDASHLESRNMMAVISLDGGVDLYSGCVHVAKILISGVSSSVVTSSYLSDTTAGPTFFTKPSPGSFPKRSSLLPQATNVDSPAFNEILSQFSPVTTSPDFCSTYPNSREGSLVAIRDNVKGRITLEYSSALLFRLELPNFGNSPLVDSSLSILRRVLPHDVALQFLIKWYCARNAPGCYHVELDEEFNMFSSLLFGSIGYDLSKLKENQMDQSGQGTMPKKQRTCELQSDEDWAALINSNHHGKSSQILSTTSLSGVFLQPQDCPLSPDIVETPVVASRATAQKNMDASTTPYISDRSKRLMNKKDRSTLEPIDETPLHTKSSLGKGKISSSRFHKSLEKGEIDSPMAESSGSKGKSTTLIKNRKSLLFPYVSTIFYSLHLLYEDMKLSTVRTSDVSLLITVLHRLARDLGCDRFVHHYWVDNPRLCRLEDVSSSMPDLDPTLRKPVPSIFRHLNDIIVQKKNIVPYPFAKGINQNSRNIIQVFGLMSFTSISSEAIYKKVLTPIHDVEDDFEDLKTDDTGNPYHRVVLLLTKLGITSIQLSTLPPGVAFTLHEALYRCRDNPGSDWTKNDYSLAQRQDLASISRKRTKQYDDPTNRLTMRAKPSTTPADNDLEEDGMEELREMDVVKLRWSADQRVIELRRLLQSAQPVRIVIQQRPDVSDHEFVQEQERLLYAISARTMALPVARGMVTLGCAKPVITEKLPVPQLCLTGRMSPSDKVVDMSHIEVPPNMNVWPLFHNGVAAGLRISPHAPDISSKWIIYNKPKINNDEQIEHAGFLMALGLNGHLKDLMDLAIFMYLVRTHEMTRIGLLLGVAVSKRGTMDVQAVKMLSVHIEAMLPPTGIELDVNPTVEPASLMALGFLYQGTAHRHIAQVLLQEIGRPPGPEMENSVDRESYSLSAGLALGLVVFGRGNSLSGLADMSIPDTLHHFMIGGPKRPYMGSQRDKYKVPSFLIFEGPLVNTHVTGPGATLALGMLYFNTGNRAIADWLKVPETQHLLETVLPDALLLRTLAKSLILWDEIQPTPEWVSSHVPEFVLPFCLVKPQSAEDSEMEIDYETMNQAYCNIVAGACMAIGLRYAGSADQEAFQTLSFFAFKFAVLLGKSLAELCGRATIETCLNVVTVSLGMVMAGTGNLQVMRLCRYLRSRVGPNNSVVTYGSHLATHMALGLLFLGGGTLTLSTSPESIAALLCAFYPKWPVCSSDNRYHSQALRHLYVLAVEPRLLLPRDIDSRTLCYAHVTYVYLDDSIYKGKVVKLLAPCLLPQLDLLKEVKIEDDRYWTIRFTVGENLEGLKKILAKNTYVDVKKRAGFLSYLDDPHGFRSLLAQTLTSDNTIPWGVKPPSMYQFSSHPLMENFMQFFFDMKHLEQCSETERKTLSALTDFSYFCLTKDKVSLLSYWLSLNKLMQSLSIQPTANAMWQWRLVFSQAERDDYQLIPADLALSVKQNILSLLSSWEPGVLVQLKEYFLNKFETSGIDDEKITAYLVFFDLPYQQDFDFSKIYSDDITGALRKTTELGLAPEAVACILPLLEL